MASYSNWASPSARPPWPNICGDTASRPSQTWRTFLDNHVQSLVSVDFFTVPTIRFQVLYVFLVLAHHRCRVVHFNVTAHPTAEWTAQQLREAFPFDQIPRYLLRDRDKIFGDDFRRQFQDMKIEEVLSAPRSPWQRAYVERLIGSIRRECLDHSEQGFAPLASPPDCAATSVGPHNQSHRSRECDSRVFKLRWVVQ